MKDKEQQIRCYFQSWIDNDMNEFINVFDPKVVYTECYGPEYHGVEQLKQWFGDWQQKGKVLEWTIKQFLHQNNVVAVEWYFKCDYENHVDGFDGVSIITFAEEKMLTVKEFQSKSEHNYPYAELT